MLKRLLRLIDETHEAVGWSLLACSSTLICLGKIDGPTYLALAGVAVVTLVGVEHFRGLRLGPGGLELPHNNPQQAQPARLDQDHGQGCECAACNREQC